MDTVKIIGLLKDMRYEYEKSVGWCNVSEELYDSIEAAIRVFPNRLETSVE